MSGLFSILLLVVALNGLIGSLVALPAVFRGQIALGELRAWGASLLAGAFIGVAPGLSRWRDDLYYMTLFWMLLVVTVVVAALVLWSRGDPARRSLGRTVYRTAVIASTAWIAGLSIVARLVAP